MKVNFNCLLPNKTLQYEEDMTFSDEMMKVVNSIRKINKCHVKAIVEDYDDIIRVEVKVQADVVLTCAYSLEPIDYHMDLDDYFDFTMNEAYEADEELFYVEKPEFDLDPYILSLLITEVPTKIVKEGAKLPKDGKGYEVITEEEFAKRQENKADPRFSKLDEIKFDN